MDVTLEVLVATRSFIGYLMIDCGCYIGSSCSHSILCWLHDHCFWILDWKFWSGQLSKCENLKSGKEMEKYKNTRWLVWTCFNIISNFSSNLMRRECCSLHSFFLSIVLQESNPLSELRILLKSCDTCGSGIGGNISWPFSLDLLNFRTIKWSGRELCKLRSMCLFLSWAYFVSILGSFKLG